MNMVSYLEMLSINSFFLVNKGQNCCFFHECR